MMQYALLHELQLMGMNLKRHRVWQAGHSYLILDAQDTDLSEQPQCDLSSLFSTFCVSAS